MVLVDTWLMVDAAMINKMIVTALETNGDHSTPRTEATNDHAIKTDSDVSARPEPDTGAVEIEDGRPRCLANSTTNPSEYV